MKLGLSTATYFTRMYTEQALEPIAKLGAQVCEIFLATHSEYTDEFAEVLKDELKKRENFLRSKYIRFMRLQISLSRNSFL